MLDSCLKVNLLLLQYCRRMIEDLPEERMAEQPVPGVNHPAWILGHLAFSADRGRRLLGAEKDLPKGWSSLFGPGSKPTSTRSDYPSKDELWEKVETWFDRLRKDIEQATPEQLAKPSINPFTKEALPTVQDGLAFLLTGHLGGHLGQLSMWRRMIGFAPLF